MYLVSAHAAIFSTSSCNVFFIEFFITCEFFSAGRRYSVAIDDPRIAPNSARCSCGGLRWLKRGIIQKSKA